MPLIIETWLSSLRPAPGSASPPCFLGDPAPELARLLPPEPSLAGELGLVTHPDLRRTARDAGVHGDIARGLRRERALFWGEAAA